MNNTALANKIQLLLSDRRHRKTARNLLIVLSIIITVLVFFSYFSIVRVTYGGIVTDGNSVKSYKYQTSPEERSPITGLSDFFIISRGTESLLFTSGESETIINTKDRLKFGYTDITIELNELAQVEKINSGGTLCPITNDTGVYSHPCANPDLFSQYVAQTNGIPKQQTILNFSSQYASTQYKDGILTWYNELLVNPAGKPATVSYLAPGKPPVEALQMPEAIMKSSNYIRIITDNTNQQNSGFVVYDYNAGIGYYYADFASSVTPKIVNRQHDLDIETESSSCTLIGTSFACYHGSAGDDTHNHGDDSEPIEIQAKPHGGVMEITDMSASTPSTNVYVGPPDTGIADLYISSDGSYYGRNGFSLIQLDLNDENFTFTTKVVNESIQLITAGAALYYTQGSKVYRYDGGSGTSELHYQANDSNIQKIIAYGDQLFILGYDKKDPAQLLNTYRVIPGVN